MKKNSILIACMAMAISASAQYMRVSDGAVSYWYAATADEMFFSPAGTLTIGNKEFSLAEYPEINICSESPVADNTVSVGFDGSQATVEIAGNVAEYIAVERSGAHVKLTQSEDVSEATCGEITYSLQGESADGSFTLVGSYKASLALNGLALTNTSGAAIDIQDGKRIELSAKSGTENFLADGPGSQKAALYCKGHLELKGKGSLNVTGNQGHAVSAKEYITVKNLTLTIPGAKKDGVNCNQYFAMESGMLNISGVGDDGIQVSFKDDVDREAEDTGSGTISGGTVTIEIAQGAASKGLKADGDITVSGGELTVTSACDGTWDSTKLKTKASACLGADGNITIDGGTLKLTATGSGGKGISCDGVFSCNGGDIDIETKGGMLVYSNGTLNHNYTSSADRIASDCKSSAKGVKADSGLVVNGGTLNVRTSSNNAEGLESKTTMEINGGTLFVNAHDDGLNSSSDLTINGGDLTVISSAGDAIDSNANLYITGGRTVALGAGGAEQGLDAADENRCYVYITGGEVLAYGGRGCPVRQTTGSQALLTAKGSIGAGTSVSIKSGSDALVEFTIPAQYNSSASGSPAHAPGGGWNPGGGPGGGSGSGQLLLSCPALVSGQSYTVTNGQTNTTATATYTSSVN